MRKVTVFNYHKVGRGKHHTSLSLLEEHFLYLQKKYSFFFPGESYKKNGAILIFDDGYFDFYHFVFPLLKKHQLKALLALSTFYIKNTTSVPIEERLSISYASAMTEGIFDKKMPFCTWEEIQEMVASGFVQIAAHSHLHANLTFDFVDLEREIVLPKKIIEEKLGQRVTSFVYPFGRWNERVQRAVKEVYPYTFRMGFGYNKSLESDRPLKRICLDGASIKEAFSWKKRLLYTLKMILS